MVTRKLSLCILSLAAAFAGNAERVSLAQDTAANADVIISDEMTSDGPASYYQPNYWNHDPAVVPTQFRPGGAARGRTSASPAAMSGSGSRAPQSFNVRLARAPNMMGDFFSLPGQTAIVGDLFTGQGTPFTHDGLAVHQSSTSMSAFADDNIAIVVTDPGTMRTIFLGGPGGVTAGTFFEPSIPAAQLENPQPGLELDGDPDNTYTAILTGDTTDVYDDPAGPITIDDAPVYQVFRVVQLDGFVSPNPAEIVGRVRVQDNNSAMPRDRIILDYNFFHNVPFTANGIDVNRFTPGVEKTFLDGLGSVEVRAPMAITFNSRQFEAVGLDTSEPEFGNLTVIPKVLLTSTDEIALAAGLGIALPTADDLDLYGLSGDQVLSIENESIHLLPFLGFLFTPRHANYFFQSFVTVDVDTNGNAVQADVGSGLEQIGIWNDQTLLSASGSFGHYLFQNYSRGSIIQSLSLMGELHYTTTVDDADTINSGVFVLGDPDRQIDVLNATFGGHVQLKDSTLTTGYSVPLTSSDRIFDGELRVFINQFF